MGVSVLRADPAMCLNVPAILQPLVRMTSSIPVMIAHVVAPGFGGLRPALFRLTLMVLGFSLVSRDRSSSNAGAH